MQMNLFYASLSLNVSLTVTAVVLLFLVFIIERKWLKKKELSMNKWIIILFYLISFMLLVATAVFVLFLWNFDITSHVQSVLSEAQNFFNQSIGPVINSVIVIFVSMTILKISKITLTHISSKDSPVKKRKQTLTKVVNSIVKYVVSLIAILIILSLWGINVAPALAGLGILGLVVGLGAQKFINDLINGFFIVFEHHFDVGDRIEVQGFKGDVIDIGLKTTKIRNWKGDTKIVSNGEISTLINFSRNFSIAIADFGIAYREDVQKTIDLLSVELPKIKTIFPEILEDPQVLGVIELGSSSVNMRVICKTESEKHYAIERELLKKIKQILDENGVEIPFPQVVVHQPNKE